MNRKRIFRAMAAMVVVMLATSVMCSEVNAQIYPVTDIQVFSKKGSPFTYKDTPNNYHRVTDEKHPGKTALDNETLDTNRGSGTDIPYVSIFYKTEKLNNSDLVGRAISDVIVVEGAKTPMPTGYIKVDCDLNKGCGSGSKYLYLAFRRTNASDTHIITDIKGYSFSKEYQLPGLSNQNPYRDELVTKYGVATPADLSEKCGHGTDYIRLVVRKKKIE